jgi:CysZ protein
MAFLVGPIASLVAGLFLDEIAAHVEASDYPDEPPGRDLPLALSLVLSAKFAAVVVLVNIFALLLLLLPGVNLVVFLVANGYLLGREYFELAALRHIPQAEAKRLRQANRVQVFLGGLMIAGLLAVPLLNLLTPLFATAFMVHLFKRVQGARDQARVFAS